MNSQPEGFSLVELLLALGIMLVTGMMLFHLFQHNERVIRDQMSVMEMQQSARVVASQIADEIRMAGQEVPIYSSNQDATPAESVAAILPTTTNNRIDFRAGLSNIEAAVIGAPPLDLSFARTSALIVGDGSAFSTTLGTTLPFGRYVYVWGPTSNSTWAWVRAELITISPTSLTIVPWQSSNMNTTTHFTGLPTLALEEAVSIYLNGGSVRRATATDLTDPVNPVWSVANIVIPTSLANRMSIRRVDVQLAVQTATVLSNGTQPSYSLTLRTIPRNLILRSAN
jgi:Tfp pilus assembly protein PilW